MGLKKFIKKLINNYKHMFNEKPKEALSAFEKNDHLELDTSELLNSDGIKTYHLMIGALQWAVSLGRFDIYTQNWAFRTVETYIWVT
jgi:hypothetical protein